MKKLILNVLILLMPLLILACAENYSNGERIGFITKFSRSGAIWKSWEIQLNLTQTGMNTATTEHLSIDNDRESEYTSMIQTLDSAAQFGWKVKLVYHQVWGCKNFCSNRGDESRFVNQVEILDRNPMDIFGGKKSENGKRDTTVIIIKDFDKLLEYLQKQNKGN